MAARDGKARNAWHGHFEPKRVPEGVWMRCEGCQATLFRKQVDENLGVCPECNHHFSLSASQRIGQLFDSDTFEEWYPGLQPLDPLGFNDRRPYPERVLAEQERTGLAEAAVVGQGFIKGIRIVFGITDSSFIMGSMGSVVGEKLTRAIEEATRQKLPAGDRLGIGGRGPHARGDFFPDADGESVDRPGAISRRRGDLRERAHQPDDGGRRGEFRLAGRLHPGRAQGPDRLRRPARHRTDRPRSASQPAFRPANSCASTVSSTGSCTAATCAA